MFNTRPDFDFDIPDIPSRSWPDDDEDDDE